MTDKPAVTRNPFADIAPALAEYTNNVLFGDLWKRPGLSPRDRSLVTVASLVALYRINELPFHLKRALENGLSRDELIEAVPDVMPAQGVRRRCAGAAAARPARGRYARGHARSSPAESSI
jgi:4-carboxymuconolactone decarboxylase